MAKGVVVVVIILSCCCLVNLRQVGSFGVGVAVCLDVGESNQLQGLEGFTSVSQRIWK